MPATQCGEVKSVIQRLLDDPCRFQFFQAVRLALQWLGEQGVPPDKALLDHLRFDNSLSLGFAASQVEALHAVGEEAIATDAGLAQALRERRGLHIRITPAFMGFLGANGALPPHYSERILAHQLSEKDEAPRAFFDMFSNRVLAQFYESWRKYRFEHAIGDGNDKLLPLLLALAGFQRKPGDAGAMRDEVVALYAGLLHQRPASSVILGRVLDDYFGVPVLVEEAIGHWNPMAPQEQTALGGANAMLGECAMLGASSWRPDLRVRLSIGPLDRAAFDRFLPGADGALALKKMLSLLGNPTVVYEVNLILSADEVRQACLGVASGCRLGLDSFLVSGPSLSDRADICYDLRPMEPLPVCRKKVAAV